MMSTPGFTAEYSMNGYNKFLFPRTRHGRINPGVIPALPPKHACSELCWSDPNSRSCYNDCLQARGGDGGGAGGGPS